MKKILNTTDIDDDIFWNVMSNIDDSDAPKLMLASRELDIMIEYQDDAQEIKQSLNETYDSLSKNATDALIEELITEDNIRKRFETINLKTDDSLEVVLIEFIYIRCNEQKPKIIKPIFDILVEISNEGIYNKNPEAQKFCIETFSHIINKSPIFVLDLSKKSMLNLIKNGYITTSSIEKILEQEGLDESVKINFVQYKDFASISQMHMDELKSDTITHEDYLKTIEKLTSLLGNDNF